MGTGTVVMGLGLLAATIAGLSVQAQSVPPVNTQESTYLNELTQREQFPPGALQINFDKFGFSNGLGTMLGTGLNDNPVLATLPGPGINQVVIMLTPCAMVTPHHHQRASEVLYVVNGTITMSIVEENGGRVLPFMIPAGQDVAIPQGLMHYNFNNSCFPSGFISTYNNKDQGVITEWQNLLRLPTDVLSAVTGMSQAALNASTPVTSGLYAVSPDCLARCSRAPAAANSG